MQHSRAANPFIRYSPAPLTQVPTMKGESDGPFVDAQQPAPYVAANPTRPLTYNKYVCDTFKPLIVIKYSVEITARQHKQMD